MARSGDSSQPSAATGRAARARLFFALRPDDAGLEALRAALPRDLAAERPVPAAHLHITLAFLGDVDASREVHVRAAASGVVAAAFALRLTTLAFWPRSRTRAALPDRVPPPALALRAALLDGLADAGVPVDRRAWRPHVTVARRARPAERRLDAPVTVRFDAFALWRSRLAATGATYETLASWPLAADGPAEGAGSGRRGWEG